MCRIVVRALLILASGLVAMPAHACMCVALAFESLVDKAEIIMVVRILRTEDVGKVGGTGSNDAESPAVEGIEYGVRAEFKVLRPLKQAGSMPERLFTGYGEDDCGVELLAGSNYLVLTDASGGVTRCSGTRKVGVEDAISCRMQAWLAAVEQRIADHKSEIVPPGDAPSEVDAKVIDALAAGRSAFEAGCEVPPMRGPELQ